MKNKTYYLTPLTQRIPCCGTSLLTDSDDNNKYNIDIDGSQGNSGTGAKEENPDDIDAKWNNWGGTWDD